jgi:hypothetical protein
VVVSCYPTIQPDATDNSLEPVLDTDHDIATTGGRDVLIREVPE